jgi:hypothetical protein
MKYILFTFLITFCFISCKSDRDKAIEICKNAKVQSSNPLGYAGLSIGATWLDYANAIAKEEPNKKLVWTADKAPDGKLYVVAFTDENGWGNRWEVDNEQQLVRNINLSDYLCRKYGLTSVDQEKQFELVDLVKESLAVKSDESSWIDNGEKIRYELKASIRNNTDKTITEAQLDGRLKLIFKDKTVEGNQKYSSGFISKISKNQGVWYPNTTKQFIIQTTGLELIYLGYVPEYVVFDLRLSAEDPVGYRYNKSVAEIDLKQRWDRLKD